MRSDPASQLVSASKELKQIRESLEWKKIFSFGKNYGMEWIVKNSADAPWENGCAESLIKSVKRALVLSVGTNIMTFSELQTVMFEVANLVNERPIGTMNSYPNEGSYLCPNDLILGRSSTRVPAGLWDCQSYNPAQRWQFVQQVVNAFWKRWHRDYFHSLIVRQKWHTAVRNLKAGDIVLVQDSNSVRGNWRLAQVADAQPSANCIFT